MLAKKWWSVSLVYNDAEINVNNSKTSNTAKI
jgi:hypothetical protein